MKWPSIILIIFYAAGIVQGISLILAISNRKLLMQLSNRIMLGLLLSITFILVFFCLLIFHIRVLPEVLGPISTAAWFATGPLFYLYTKSVLSPIFQLKGRHIFLFAVPIFNLSLIILDLLNVPIRLADPFPSLDIFAYVWLMAYLVHTVVFVLLNLRLLQLENHAKLKGLFFLFICFLATLLIAFISLLFISRNAPFFSAIEKVLALIFAFFVLLIALRSMSTSPQFSKPRSRRKYYNSILSEGRMKEIEHLLSSLMATHKPYLDKNLSLNSLSQISSIKENELSQFFNQYLKLGFYEYIREYRLAEVELRLQNPNFKNLKIASIAEDAGFKSRALFYKAFKKKHGLTPTEFLKQKEI